MSNQYCDFDMLSVSFEGDEDILLELIDDFRAEYPQMITDMENAYNNGNMEDLERFAHTLKGVISNFFSESLKNSAFIIEDQANKGSAEDFLTQIKYLKDNIPAMADEVQNYCSGKLAA